MHKVLKLIDLQPTIIKLFNNFLIFIYLLSLDFNLMIKL